MESDGLVEQGLVVELGQLLRSGGLPLGTVDGSFAYGSGAIPQAGQASLAANMADFVLIVPSAEDFHAANVAANPGHYSGLRFLGARRLADVQRRFGARTFYNTLVRVPGCRLIKYGVIEAADLCTDLLDWDHLYIAGRLHKPVYWLKTPPPSVLKAQRTNLKSAIHVSLLTLPEQFNLTQLFTTITALSYSGDFRTTFGEDRNKIANIVAANEERFFSLYHPLLKDLQQVHVSGSDVSQDVSPRAVFDHLELFPRELLWRIQDAKPKTANMDLEEMMFDLSHSVSISSDVNGAVASIVRQSSISQSIKNAFTAGAVKTLRYSLLKMSKMLRSIR